MYRGLPLPEAFKIYLSPKARLMQYWRGGKQTAKEVSQPPSSFELASGDVKGSSGPERKL